MLSDVEKGRRTEIEAINGYVVERGEALKLDVTANKAVLSLVRVIERTFPQQQEEKGEIE